MTAKNKGAYDQKFNNLLTQISENVDVYFCKYISKEKQMINSF